MSSENQHFHKEKSASDGRIGKKVIIATGGKKQKEGETVSKAPCSRKRSVKKKRKPKQTLHLKKTNREHKDRLTSKTMCERRKQKLTGSDITLNEKKKESQKSAMSFALMLGDYGEAASSETA